MSEIYNYIRQRPCKLTVANRLIRLNPNLHEGEIVRGRYRKPLSWRRAKTLLKRGKDVQNRFRLPWGAVYDPMIDGPFSAIKRLVRYG